MNTFWQDVRHGLRVLRKDKSFTLIAILTLALGIGVNGSVFSLVNAILIRPLPYPDPEQLVGLGQSRMQQGAGYIQTGVSFPNVKEIAQQNAVFSHVAYYRFHSYNLTNENAPERVLSFQISHDFLPMFGVPPHLGRFFTEEESTLGKNDVAIISFGLWQRRFAGTADILGKAVTLDQHSYTIVGVMPKTFQFTWDAPIDVLVPLALTPEEMGESARTSRDLETLARMKPGVTHDQAQTEMKTVAARLAEEYPAANNGWNITVEPLHAAYHRQLVEPLVLVMCAVSVVLLIVCANVANLLLSRATARRREVTIRLAMGASRGRMIRQFLTESLLLGLFGGLAGLAVAYWGTAILRALAVKNIGVPGVREMSMDWRVVLYCLGISILTSVIFGLAPALQASKADLIETLKETGLSVTAESGRRHLRSALVVAEMALAIVLMSSAGLLLRSFVHILGADIGFDPKQAVTMWISLPSYKYATGDKQFAFFRDTLDRIRVLPGIVAAGARGGNGRVFFMAATQARPSPGQEPTADEQSISSDFFRAMGAKFVAGRDFSSADAPTAPPVAIINQTLARRYWPGSTPIGDHLVLLANVYDSQSRTPTQSLEIVGVVGDIKTSEDVWEDYSEIYVPYAQHPTETMGLIVRTQQPNPMTELSSIRSAVLSVDSTQPVDHVLTLEEMVSANHQFLQFPMDFVWTFAVLALILAAMGVFGVMSYSVSQRTHEVAIRMALGADGANVLKLMLREGLRITLIGVGIGIAVALAVGRFIAGYLYGVKAYDPVTFVAVALLLISVALAACYLPARRATRVDPMVALRYE